MSIKLFNDKTFIILAIVLLSFIITLVVGGDPTEKISPYLMILIAFILLGIYGINNFIISKATGKRITKNTEDMIIELSKKLENMEIKINSTIEAHGYPWLLKQKEIAGIELAMKEMDIWIVTPDLHNDTHESEFIDVVKENISRGVKYTYILLDEPLIRTRLQRLKNIFKKHPDKLDYIFIDPDTFHLTANLCFAIYNPKSIDGRPSKVYVEIKQLDGDDNRLWVELPEEKADTFSGTISNLIKKNNREREKDI